MPLFIKFIICIIFIVPSTFSYAKTAVYINAVESGDVIISIHRGQLLRLKLAGIVCPREGGSAWLESKKSLSELVLNKLVDISIGMPSTGKKQDKSGTPLVTVWINGVDINAMQIVRGMASVYRNDGKPVKKYYKSLELSARDAQRGIWSHRKPTYNSVN